jgi:hypothetical protein
VDRERSDPTPWRLESWLWLLQTRKTGQWREILELGSSMFKRKRVDKNLEGKSA